ncbi:MAG: hypothetical protein H6561_02490 [Lewinellaceae bacterium]|nr:hypothetical protein [Lewinellaceae bacterium]
MLAHLSYYLLAWCALRPQKEPEGELSSQIRQPASEEQISQALNSWSPATNTDQEEMTPVEASQEDKKPENPTGKEPEKPAKKPPLNANENNPPKNSAKDTKKPVDPNINQEENPVATDDHQQPEKEFPAPEEREAEQPVKEIAESQPPVKNIDPLRYKFHLWKYPEHSRNRSRQITVRKISHFI